MFAWAFNFARREWRRVHEGEKAGAELEALVHEQLATQGITIYQGYTLTSVEGNAEAHPCQMGARQAARERRKKLRRRGGKPDFMEL